MGLFTEVHAVSFDLTRPFCPRTQHCHVVARHRGSLTWSHWTSALPCFPVGSPWNPPVPGRKGRRVSRTAVSQTVPVADSSVVDGTCRGWQEHAFRALPTGRACGLLPVMSCLQEWSLVPRRRTRSPQTPPSRCPYIQSALGLRTAPAGPEHSGPARGPRPAQPGAVIARRPGGEEGGERPSAGPGRAEECVVGEKAGDTGPSAAATLP